ncbi:hypothetical protein ACWD6P_28485 [Streptomyces sp. NPDC002446]
MSHDYDEPRHLLVQASGGRSPLYTAEAGFHAEVEQFALSVPVEEPELSLPDDLADRLVSWSQARPENGFTSRPQLRKHARQGREAAQRVAKHLGPLWVVRYRDEAHDSVKFVCWGCDRLHWTIDTHGTPPHPVHVIVQGEYHWYPLRAEGFEDFAPDDPAAALHLSDILVSDLYQWAKDIDEAMNTWLEDRDDARQQATYERLDHVGETLAERVARELGPGRKVTYRGV